MYFFLTRIKSKKMCHPDRYHHQQKNAKYNYMAIYGYPTRDVGNPYIVYGISVNKLIYREQRDDKPYIANYITFLHKIDSNTLIPVDNISNKLGTQSRILFVWIQTFLCKFDSNKNMCCLVIESARKLSVQRV